MAHGAAGRTRGEEQMHKTDLLTVGEIARRSGFADSAVRYYEGLGLLPASRTPTRADWARLSRGWRSRLDDQIEALVALRDGLDSCIGCGCLSLDRCTISNPSDSARPGGPGAVYLPAGLRREENARRGDSARATAGTAAL